MRSFQVPFGLMPSAWARKLYGRNVPVNGADADVIRTAASSSKTVFV